MLHIILMGISSFVFFLLITLLAVYFIFILDYRNYVRQKANSSIFFFLFKFKMVHKAAETTRNVNNTFGPGTAIEQTVQWWFKKFCKGDQSLEDEEHSGWPSEVDNDQLRAIINANPLYNYTRKCPRIQCQLFYGHLAFEANWKGKKAQ